MLAYTGYPAFKICWFLSNPFKHYPAIKNPLIPFLSRIVIQSLKILVYTPCYQNPLIPFLSIGSWYNPFMPRYILLIPSKSALKMGWWPVIRAYLDRGQLRMCNRYAGHQLHRVLHVPRQLWHGFIYCRLDVKNTVHKDRAGVDIKCRWNGNIIVIDRKQHSWVLASLFATPRQRHVR